MTIKNNMLYVAAFVAAFGLAAVMSWTSHQASASALSTLAGRDLGQGDQGLDVVDLQGLLAEQGYLNVPMGVPFGYFGPLTKAGLAQYQASIGVSATGYYGPITRAKIVQVFTARGWMALLARENA